MLIRVRRWLVRVRRWLASEKSWPLLLLVLFGAYWFSPRDIWASFTFAFVSLVYMALMIAWILEYWQVQRKAPNLLFVASFLAFGLALMISSLLASPRPLLELERWRPVSRVLWMIGLPFFAVAVYFEFWRVVNRLFGDDDN